MRWEILKYKPDIVGITGKTAVIMDTYRIAGRMSVSDTTEEKIIKNKTGVKLTTAWGNVSQTCKVIGYSHDRFLPFQFEQSLVILNSSLIYGVSYSTLSQ